jgi:hypothetical protein
MKRIMKHLKFVPLAACLVALFAFALMAQSPNGVHGAFTGNLQLPSPFTFTFGTGQLANDVSIGKNGANVLGHTGNIGGSGAVANTTITPAGPFAWGKVTFSAATTVVPVFAKAFAVAPVCIVTAEAGALTYTVTPTASQVTITGSSSSSNAVDYVCFGNPN